ncbi:MAG: tetratricopeptide repeat protein [Gammaproteobacteria bacterium]|nr:tetratricopeptide repeat protein [Gammaproteobacteria bacterium]
MTEYLTDEEQVERIKKWWSDNGSSVIAGLVIGIGGLSGWRFWVDYRDNLAAEASAQFSEMVAALDQRQHDSAIEHANIILDEYGSTAYADLARLSLAKAYVEAGEFNQAGQQLEMIVDGNSEAAIKLIARQRLAAVLLQQGKLEQALSTVNIEYPSEFAAVFEELKGDILVAQGKNEQAIEAYQKARLAQPAVPNAQFLQQKLEDLGRNSLNS